MDDESAAGLRGPLEECLQNPGLPVEIVFRFRRKDGSWVDLAGTAVNRLDEPANAAIVVNFRDIGDRLRAQEALRATQQFNQAIIEGAGEGIVVYDRKLRYVAWNPAMEKLTGMSESDVLGRSADELFPHLRASGTLRLLERALAGERMTSEDIEFRVARTGRSGWVSASYSPHRNPAGEIVGVIGMIRDVSDRVRAQEVIRARERQLVEAQTVAQLGSWEWDVPSDVVFWSDELCRICGIAPDAAPVELESLLMLVHPEDRVMVERELRAAIRDVRPIAFDARFLRPSGPPRILQARGRVVSDQAGRPLRLVATGHDITESRAAEQAVRVRDRAMAAIPQALLITDNTQFDNPVVYVNPAFEKLTGYRSADIVGKNCRLLQGRDTDPAAVRTLREAVRAGRALHGLRIRNYRKDGSAFWNSVSVEPICDDSGRPTHFVGVLSEISDTASAESEAAATRTAAAGFDPARR
jgi:PAS domain S-box-containing protein